MFKNIDFIAKIKNEFMEHISGYIESKISECKINKSKISLLEYDTMRLNSYEQKYIEPFLDDEALIWKIENAIKNCSTQSRQYGLPRHYDEYLMTDGINELLKRFKENNNV